MEHIRSLHQQYIMYSTHVVLLEQVLAEARRHELPARLGVGGEVSLAALTPGRRDVRVELHCTWREFVGAKGNARKGALTRRAVPVFGGVRTKSYEHYSGVRVMVWSTNLWPGCYAAGYASFRILSTFLPSLPIEYVVFKGLQPDRRYF